MTWSHAADYAYKAMEDAAKLHTLSEGEREVMHSGLKARGAAVNLGMKALTGEQRERQINIATVRTLMKVDPESAKSDSARKLLSV